MAERIEPETGKSSIRLYVTTALVEGASITLPREQTHYLKNVMRRSVGDLVRLFNGSDGEWQCIITSLNRNDSVLEAQSKLRDQVGLPDVWLLFAPIKKVRLDYLAQKATEMGASKLQPVITSRTQVSRVNVERLTSNAIEASEQCGCLAVPDVAEPTSLKELLSGWDPNRKLVFCDEAPDVRPALEVLATAADGPFAILIGPEGGFDPQERDFLRSLSFVLPVSLGPRIMRADTAAVAALGIWQATRGDWS